MVFMRRRGYSNTWKIRLYRYGLIWKTLEVKRGQSVTLGACNTVYSDDTFYGWATAYNSVTRRYTSSSNVKPTSDINLYAVFSYTVQNSTNDYNYNVTSSSDTRKSFTYTVTATGTATFTSYCEYWTGGSGTSDFIKDILHPNFVAATINGNYIRGTPPIVKSVSKGDVVVLYAAGCEHGASGAFYDTYTAKCLISYPITQTKYRVVSHS